MPKLNQPIKVIKSELITVLEFIRIARGEFPKTTDKILSHMDLSDEAFDEVLGAIAAFVDFDLYDDGGDDGSDD